MEDRRAQVCVLVSVCYCVMWKGRLLYTALHKPVAEKYIQDYRLVGATIVEKGGASSWH